MSFASLPEKLKAMPNWVVWKSVAKDGRLTKIPFNVKTGQWAKADDPTTWTTFENAGGFEHITLLAKKKEIVL